MWNSTPLRYFIYDAPTPIPSQFRPPTQKPSHSIPILKATDSKPALNKQVNFDPYTKTELNSTNTLKPSNYRSAHQNTVNCNHRQKNMSISIRTPHEVHIDRNQVNYGAPTQNMSVSIQTLKPSHFWPWHKKQSNPIHPRKTEVYRSHNRHKSFSANVQKPS